jgi:hypothetical protein
MRSKEKCCAAMTRRGHVRVGSCAVLQQCSGSGLLYPRKAVVVAAPPLRGKSPTGPDVRICNKERCTGDVPLLFE